VQDESSRGGRDPGRDRDQVGPQGRPPGFCVPVRGGGSGGTQDVEREAGQRESGGVGVELPRWGVGQRSVLQLGDHLLDDGVIAGRLVRGEGGEGGVGDEPVMPPRREQLVLSLVGDRG